MGFRFEWDPNKARANLANHGVSFEEASTAFSDPLSVTIYDQTDSDIEDRWIILGLSMRRHLLAVIHTDRGDSSH